MLREGMTIREAAEVWVQEMNDIPQTVIERMMQDAPDEWQEITKPARYNRVYLYEHNCYGTIKDVEKHDEQDEDVIYVVSLDGSLDSQIKCKQEDFEVRYDYALPIWGTMWTFGDSTDDYWLEELGGIEAMSECGFRVYENEDFGYVFGIDGAGYDFYELHWIPLYKRRGLEWHDERTENGEFYMTEERKAQLYEGLLNCLCTLVDSATDQVEWLKEAGFTDEEIAYEGFEVTQ